MRSEFHDERRGQRPAGGGFLLCAWLSVLLAAGWALNAPAQGTNRPGLIGMPAESFGQVKNFFVPDYYESPNQNQMKSLLRGAEAEPQPNGRVLIHELLVETYAVSGKVEMTVHAPECVYDPADQTASSASRIEVSTGDGGILVEGEGFLWHNADSTFTISNRQHTVIRQTPVKAPAP